MGHGFHGYVKLAEGNTGIFWYNFSEVYNTIVEIWSSTNVELNGCAPKTKDPEMSIEEKQTK
jgi:hypothetical protein